MYFILLIVAGQIPVETQRRDIPKVTYTTQEKEHLEEKEAKRIAAEEDQAIYAQYSKLENDRDYEKLLKKSGFTLTNMEFSEILDKDSLTKLSKRLLNVR